MGANQPQGIMSILTPTKSCRLTGISIYGQERGLVIGGKFPGV